MANPHPNERELYERIKNENITVDPLIWDTLYHYLGDYISAIALSAYYFVEKNEPMPVSEAKTVIRYTRKIIEIVGKVFHPEKIDGKEADLGRIAHGQAPLHPVIHEFFMHYVPNDVNCINFRVSYYLDPIDEQPVPVEEVKKILQSTDSMRQFLDKMREVTNAGKGYQPRKDRP